MKQSRSEALLSLPELTLTLALNLLRRVKELDARMSKGEHLTSINSLGRTLKGKTLGLIGMGAIARSAAEMFSVSQPSRSKHSPDSC